jgi:hypothetical protein
MCKAGALQEAILYSVLLSVSPIPIGAAFGLRVEGQESRCLDSCGAIQIVCTYCLHPPLDGAAGMAQEPRATSTARRIGLYWGPLYVEIVRRQGAITR